MNPRLTDIQKISRRRCQTKGCPNKAIGIFKKKFLCKECYLRANPTSKDRKFKYVNYIPYWR
ncbi:hypothetical protein LCGC14_0546110 [marine sediment metagenome]|uniref:Uncharacterized protein n=1 Tax=marine sediment metagenome TaxID=412755 RepID=A0A0F9UCT1_9ZZZZ